MRRLLLLTLLVGICLGQRTTGQAGGTTESTTNGGPLATVITTVASARTTAQDAITGVQASVTSVLSNVATSVTTNRATAATTASSSSSSAATGPTRPPVAAFSSSSRGSSSGHLFSSSVVSSAGSKTNAAADTATAVNAGISSSSFGVLPAFGGFSSSGRTQALVVSSSSFSSSDSGPAAFDSSSTALTAFGGSTVSGSSYIKPSAIPSTVHPTAYWELQLAYEDPCLGFRNRTLMLSTASVTAYESAYSGCRFRSYSSSVLFVRSNLTSSKEQKKDLSSVRSRLKSTAGVLSDSLVSLDTFDGGGRHLSGGAIAGIVVGVLVFVALIAGACIYFVVLRAEGSSDEGVNADYKMMKDQLVPGKSSASRL